MEVKSNKLSNPIIAVSAAVGDYDFKQDLPIVIRSNKKRPDNLFFDTSATSSSINNTNYFPIELIDLYARLGSFWQECKDKT
ncbi:hypothetical protein HN51_052748 [Arachis hypogaea]